MCSITKNFNFSTIFGPRRRPKMTIFAFVNIKKSYFSIITRIFLAGFGPTVHVDISNVCSKFEPNQTKFRLRRTINKLMNCGEIERNSNFLEFRQRPLVYIVLKWSWLNQLKWAVLFDYWKQTFLIGIARFSQGQVKYPSAFHKMKPIKRCTLNPATLQLCFGHYTSGTWNLDTLFIMI